MWIYKWHKVLQNGKKTLIQLIWDPTALEDKTLIPFGGKNVDLQMANTGWFTEITVDNKRIYCL